MSVENSKKIDKVFVASAEGSGVPLHVILCQDHQDHRGDQDLDDAVLLQKPFEQAGKPLQYGDHNFWFSTVRPESIETMRKLSNHPVVVMPDGLDHRHVVFISDQAIKNGDVQGAVQVYGPEITPAEA